MMLERQLHGNEQFMQLCKVNQLKKFQAKMGLENMTHCFPMETYNQMVKIQSKYVKYQFEKFKESIQNYIH